MPAVTRAARWVKAPMVPDALGYVWVAGRGVLQRTNIGPSAPQGSCAATRTGATWSWWRGACATPSASTTTPTAATRRIVPAGFKVVRVDMSERKVVDFAVNRIAGGASILPHNGFERPVDCRFGPDGSLYVVDWGEMVPAPERGGVEIRIGTGVLWRIRRTAPEHGDLPPEPLVLPVNLLRAVAPVAGVAAGAAIVRAGRRARRPKAQ